MIKSFRRVKRASDYVVPSSNMSKKFLMMIRVKLKVLMMTMSKM